MSLLADGRTHDDIAVIPDAADGGRARRLHLPSAQTVVALVAGLFIVMYAVVALLRLRYPYELEWIEGGMVNHVAQIRAGHSLYGPPSVGFTPDIYTPLYYVVAAGVTFLAGIGFFSLRLVSLLASFALLGALAKLAHRETDSRAAALVAAGLFAATLPHRRRVARHRARGHAVPRVAVLGNGGRTRRADRSTRSGRRVC